MSDKEPILHPVAIAKVMINFAASYGIAEDTCFDGTGITRQLLSDSESLISRDQEMKLIENLIRALPDIPALGFKLGLKYNVSNFGIWGFALRTCRTLRDAANLAIKYLPLSTAYCHVSICEDEEFFGLSMDPCDIPMHLRQFLLERDLATCFNLFHELNLAEDTVVLVELEGPPPSYAKDISRLLGLEPSYCDRNTMAIRVEKVDQALPTFDANLVRLLEAQCQRQLEQRQSTGLKGLVREQLLGPLGLVASLDEVAAAVNMSTRSLRRKLEHEGTNFRALIEEERRQIALQLINGTDIKLDEIAIHLGYTDTASFTRAFRRWMNCSPGEYRKTRSI